MYHDAGQFAGQIILFAEANRLVWLATVVDSLSSRVNTPSPFMVGACFAAFYWLALRCVRMAFLYYACLGLHLAPSHEGMGVIGFP